MHFDIKVNLSSRVSQVDLLSRGVIIGHIVLLIANFESHLKGTTVADVLDLARFGWYTGLVVDVDLNVCVCVKTYKVFVISSPLGL